MRVALGALLRMEATASCVAEAREENILASGWGREEERAVSWRI